MNLDYSIEPHFADQAHTQSVTMAKGKRGHEETETYDSDGGFVSNDDGSAPKSKKSKKAAPAKNGTSESKMWEVSASSEISQSYL